MSAYGQRYYQAWQLYEENKDPEYEKLKAEWDSAPAHPSSPRLARSSPYQQITGITPYGITTPRSGPIYLARYKRPFKDPYAKRKAQFELRPKLPAIPESGSPNLARFASSNFDGATKQDTKKNGTVVNSEPEKVPPSESAIVSDKDLPNGHGIGNGKDVEKDGLDYKSVDSESSRSRSSSRKPRDITRANRLRVWMCIGVIILLVLMGVATSVIAIYFAVETNSNNQQTASSATPLPDIPQVNYFVSWRMRGVQYLDKLSDPDSSQFKHLESEVCTVMDAILVASDLRGSFLSCSVSRFRAGSIISIMNISFSKNHLMDAKGIPLFEDVLMTLYNTVSTAIANPADTKVEDFKVYYNVDQESLLVGDSLETLSSPLPPTTTTFTTTTTTANTTVISKSPTPLSSTTPTTTPSTTTSSSTTTSTTTTTTTPQPVVPSSATTKEVDDVTTQENGGTTLSPKIDMSTTEMPTTADAPSATDSPPEDGAGTADSP